MERQVINYDSFFLYIRWVANINHMKADFCALAHLLRLLFYFIVSAIHVIYHVKI